MKHHLILAASTVIALASGSALADGTVITGATPIGGPTLLPDASLRSTFSPPALFSGPPPSWTGPYLGVNAGYLSDGGSAVNIGAFPIGPGAYPSDIAVLSGSLTPNGSSFLGGAQFGYNYQFSDALFAGVETDIQGSNSEGELRSRERRALRRRSSLYFRIRRFDRAEEHSVSWHGSRSRWISFDAGNKRLRDSRPGLWSGRLEHD